MQILYNVPWEGLDFKQTKLGAIWIMRSYEHKPAEWLCTCCFQHAWGNIPAEGCRVWIVSGQGKKDQGLSVVCVVLAVAALLPPWLCQCLLQYCLWPRGSQGSSRNLWKNFATNFFTDLPWPVWLSKAQTLYSFFFFPKEALPTCFLSKEIQILTTDPAVTRVVLYSVYSTPPPQECCFYWALPCRVPAQTLPIRLCDN